MSGMQTQEQVRFRAPREVDPAVRARLDEQAAEFERDGVLVIPGAVAPETIERIREATDAIVEELGPKGRWHGKANAMKRRIEYRGIFNLDERFMELLTPPAVFPLVVHILGPNIHMMSSQLLYARPGQDPSAGNGLWHRDLIGSSEDLGYDKTPRMAIRVGYYLSDVSAPGSGVTLFVPGSHELKHPLPLDAETGEPDSWTRLDIKPGDAVLWENRTFHSAENNTSPNLRKAVMIQYGYRWLRPVDYLSHPAELLDRCDPVTRQLLASDDFMEDGSMLRMKGAQALTDWAGEQGLAPGRQTAAG